MNIFYLSRDPHEADDWDARGIPMRWYGKEAV
jgi:hypothetical protein